MKNESPKSHSKVFTYINIGIFVVLSAALIWYLFPKLQTAVEPDSIGHKPKIVVVNSQVITKAAMEGMKKSVGNKKIDAGSVELMASDFARKFAVIMDLMRSAGYVVLNEKSAIVWPPESDITLKVAEKLGLKIDYRPMTLSEQIYQKGKALNAIN